MLGRALASTGWRGGGGKQGRGHSRGITRASLSTALPEEHSRLLRNEWNMCVKSNTYWKVREKEKKKKKLLSW